MHKKFHLKVAVVLASVVVISILMMMFNHYLPKKEVKAFSSQVIRRGSTGEDVRELQSRLQYIGYFKGKVDGVFGWNTYWALRNFQKAFGMPVDGVAGTKVKEKLLKATKYTASTSNPPASKPSTSNQTKPGTKPIATNMSYKPDKNKKPTVNAPNGYSANDIKLMANAVYGESRGEPYIGQVAVAAVILNRVTSSSFPNSIAGVIYQPGAFTAVADGQINLTPNETAKKAVVDAIGGWDPTTGCIYYYNPKTATNQWIRNRPKILTIGQHIFCK